MLKTAVRLSEIDLESHFILQSLLVRVCVCVYVCLLYMMAKAYTQMNVYTCYGCWKISLGLLFIDMLKRLGLSDFMG